MTYPLGKDPLEGKPCETCPDYATNCAAGCTREGDGHDSDCATHDAPAYPTGECDCSAQDDATQYNPWRAHIYAAMKVGAGDTAADDEEPEWQNAVQAAFGGIVQTPQG